MPLSPREEKVLATLEAALRADDPGLDALLVRSRAATWASVVRPVVALAGVLLALVAAVALFRPGGLGTAALTVALVGPWVVLTARSPLRRGSRRSSPR